MKIKELLTIILLLKMVEVKGTFVVVILQHLNTNIWRRLE